MTQNKYRLVTRADFDGIVCGALLTELGIIEDVVFTEPKEVQDGEFPVTPNDITANLPYRPEAHLCFDHHVSETLRIGEKTNRVMNAKAPSTARIIYDHYGGRERFPDISPDLLQAVDKADSAQYSEDEILAPTGWTLLNFIMDPRTGLTRFRNFATPNDQMMKDLMLYCRHHKLEEILALPDIVERIHTYIEHDEMFEHQIRRCSTLQGHVLVTDLRREETIYACNRFMVYALYPEAKVSIQVSPEEGRERTILAVGKSIIDRSAKVDIGPLMLEYGGGGHSGAGTCRIPNQDADRVLAEIVKRINAAG